MLLTNNCRRCELTEPEAALHRVCTALHHKSPRADQKSGPLPSSLTQKQSWVEHHHLQMKIQFSPKESHWENKLLFLFIFYFFIFLKIHLFLYALLFCLHERLWGCHIPWNWSYRKLWAAIWVLGVEPRSSGRVRSVEPPFQPQKPMAFKGRVHAQEWMANRKQTQWFLCLVILCL